MRSKIRSTTQADTPHHADPASTNSLQSPEAYTPNAEFFTQPVRAIPQLNADYWALMLSGLVETPLIIAYHDLLALPQTELDCTLACGGQQPGGDMIGHALWRGVSLAHLFQEIEISPQAAYARFYAADGYVTSLPLAQTADLVIAHQMNNAPLAPEHGFPARLIAPGRYGYKMPRWLRRIELAAHPALSVWEKRGWPQAGTAQTTISVISPTQHTADQPIEIAGFAYGGSQPLTAIEVSIDAGPWMPVSFHQPVPASRVRWSINWFAPSPGSYQIAARAVNHANQSATHSTIFNIR